MRAWRKGAVGVGLALIVGGTSWEVIHQSEHWPFSAYPMFSRLEAPGEIDRIRLIGISADGDRFDLAKGRYLAPFTDARLRSALSKLIDPGKLPELQEALRSLGRHYDLRRTQGKHDGPELWLISLENETWSIGDQPRITTPVATAIIADFRLTGPSDEDRP